METDEEDQELSKLRLLHLETKVVRKSEYTDDQVKVMVTCNEDKNGQEMLSYFIVPTQKRGKFMPKEAKKLGCNPKQHFKKLAFGEDVTLDDGTVIYSSQVLEKSLPSESFIINFIPDVSYIDSVISNPKYSEFFAENIPETTKLSLIYHSTETLEIFQNDSYLEFMKKFGTDVKHVID